MRHTVHGMKGQVKNMTIAEAVRRIAEIIGSGFEADKPAEMVRELDMRARVDILGEDPGAVAGDDILVLPAPYDMAYIYHAVARIFFEREEFELYNNYYERASELYSAYARWYRRNHKGKVWRVRGLW